MEFLKLISDFAKEKNWSAILVYVLLGAVGTLWFAWSEARQELILSERNCALSKTVLSSKYQYKFDSMALDKITSQAAIIAKMERQKEMSDSFMIESRARDLQLHSRIKVSKKNSRIIESEIKKR